MGLQKERMRTAAVAYAARLAPTFRYPRMKKGIFSSTTHTLKGMPVSSVAISPTPTTPPSMI